MKPKGWVISGMKISILLAVLLVGLLFLPARVFAAFSACLLLGLPTARWPRVYSWRVRAIVAPALASVGLLCAWGVKIAIANGSPLPLAQLVPPLGILCEHTEQILDLFAMTVSPACRLLLHDPRREYGFGLFLQLLLLINLICIRRWNLQSSLRESDARAEGFAATGLFAFQVAILSVLIQRGDAELASLIEGPYVIPTGVSFLLSALIIFVLSALHVGLYPWRKRKSGL
jgi:hypothetical protein